MISAHTILLFITHTALRLDTLIQLNYLLKQTHLMLFPRNIFSNPWALSAQNGCRRGCRQLKAPCFVAPTQPTRPINQEVMCFKIGPN